MTVLSEAQYNNILLEKELFLRTPDVHDLFIATLPTHVSFHDRYCAKELGNKALCRSKIYESVNTLIASLVFKETAMNPLDLVFLLKRLRVLCELSEKIKLNLLVKLYLGIDYRNVIFYNEAELNVYMKNVLFNYRTIYKTEKGYEFEMWTRIIALKYLSSLSELVLPDWAAAAKSNFTKIDRDVLSIFEKETPPVFITQEMYTSPCRSLIICLNEGKTVPPALSKSGKSRQKEGDFIFNRFVSEFFY